MRGSDLRPRGSAPTDQDPIKVVFIAGMTRSGSTVLSDLLGQIPGIVSIGELTAVWNRGLLENRHCGCGAPFRDCPFWKVVMGPYLSESLERIQQMFALRNRLFTVPALRRLARRDRIGLKSDLAEYSDVLARIYGKIQRHTGCSVIVDSSKYPVHGYAAGLAPGIRLHVVHLVRDPRAVAYSWQRKKVETPAGAQVNYMPRFRIRRSAFNWILNNMACQAIWSRNSNGQRYMRLHYENFARAPKETLARICTMVGYDAELDFFEDSSTARLAGVTHQLAGNPVRFKKDRVTIAPDREWTSTMPLKDRMLTTAITWPMLLYYRYDNR